MPNLISSLVEGENKQEIITKLFLTYLHWKCLFVLLQAFVKAISLSLKNCDIFINQE